jgi:hypothetical protein
LYEPGSPVPTLTASFRPDETSPLRDDLVKGQVNMEFRDVRHLLLMTHLYQARLSGHLWQAQDDTVDISMAVVAEGTGPPLARRRYRGQRVQREATVARIRDSLDRLPSRRHEVLGSADSNPSRRSVPHRVGHRCGDRLTTILIRR